MNPIGPSRPSAIETAPNAIAHAQRAEKPKTLSDSFAAAIEMMISSNVDQPRFCATLRTVGAYEPRRPSGARRSTMPGTRPSLPIRPARPSRRFPATAPTRIARSAVFRERAGTRKAPSTITRRLMERLPQRSIVSSSPSTRRRSGTGSMPQFGVCSSLNFARFAGMAQTGLAIRVGDNYSPSAGMTQSRFNAFSLSLARARHRGLATLAGVLLALVVAGCGGSGGGQLSKADYQKHLRTDGDEITKAFKPLTQQPSSLDQLASELGTGVSKLNSAAGDLEGVKPPTNVKTDNAKLAAGLRELAR